MFQIVNELEERRQRVFSVPTQKDGTFAAEEIGISTERRVSALGEILSHLYEVEDSGKIIEMALVR
jgi:hypothetical protein